MAKENTQVFEALVMALPKLKTAPVTTKNDGYYAVEDIPLAESGAKPLDKENAVRKIIRYLESSER